MSPPAKSILLVEDSDDDVLIFKRAYKEAGTPNPLRIVHDGEDAVAYLSGDGAFSNRTEHPFPVLMFLDLKMPGKSGFDVLKWMRGEAATKELRVIVMTSSDEVTTVNRAYKLGANSFIVKSMSISELAAQLRDVQKHWL